MTRDKYTLKIPLALKDVIQQFIDEHPEMGYRSVSEYLNELVRNEVKRILQQANNIQEAR